MQHRRVLAPASTHSCQGSGRARAGQPAAVLSSMAATSHKGLPGCCSPPPPSLSQLLGVMPYSLSPPLRTLFQRSLVGIVSLSGLRTHCWGLCLPLDRGRAGRSPPEAPAASPSELPRGPGSSPAAAEPADSLPSPLPQAAARPSEAVVSGHLPDSSPRAGQWPDSSTRTAVSSQEARGRQSGSSRTKPCTARARSAHVRYRAGLAGAALYGARAIQRAAVWCVTGDRSAERCGACPLGHAAHDSWNSMGLPNDAAPVPGMLQAVRDTVGSASEVCTFRALWGGEVNMAGEERDRMTRPLVPLPRSSKSAAPFQAWPSSPVARHTSQPALWSPKPYLCAQQRGID